MRLSGKTILVTGSSTGIGEAIARRCAAEGANVVVHGRNRERTEAVAASIGTAALAHVDNLADAQAPARMIDAVLSQFCQLDGIVNNAAYVVRSNLSSTTVDLFDEVMATNVRCPLLLIQAAREHLKKTSGSVVNIGSVNGYSGEPNLLAYSISKGALMTMSRNLADSLAQEGIRVNHINPGWVLTPNEYEYKLADGLPENWPAQVPPEIAPSGRLIKPEEIAAGVLYWLSDESRPISGTVMEMEQYPFVGRNMPRA